MRRIGGRGGALFHPLHHPGGPGSLCDGTYKGIWDAIDRCSCEKFGHKLEDIEASRLPMNIMF